MKKTLSLISAIFCLSASAMETTGDFAINGLEYDFYSTGVMLVGYNSSCQGDVVVPSSVTYKGESYKVLELSDYSFQGCTALTSIELPNSLIRIGSKSFYGCTNLWSIEVTGDEMSDSKYYSWDGVLYANGDDGTQLAAFPAARSGVFDMPDNVVTIWMGAFGYTKLNKISMSQFATAIKANTFENSSKLIIEIDNSEDIIAFDDAAFENATGYTIYAPKSCQSDYASQPAIGSSHIGMYDEVGGIRYATTSGSKKTVVGLTLGAYPTNLVVPATVTINGYEYDVTEISDYALSCCCDLETVTLPSSIERLGSMNFVECFMLREVNLGNIKYTVKDGILYSNDTTYDIPLSQLAVCPAAVTGSVEIPSSVVSIWKGAFSHAKISDVVISSTLQEVKDETFKGCNNLKTVTFTTTNVPTKGFGKDVFAGCETVTIRVPKGCKSKFEAAVSHLKNVIVLEEGEKPTKIGSATTNNVRAMKLIKDGRIVISKDGVLYDLNGMKL